MTTLISGGTGFVGLNIAEYLLARGDTVVIYALDTPPEPALQAFARLPGRLVVQTGDVRDTASFMDCLRRHKVERLLPFAAVTSGPGRESLTPELVFEVNLLGFIGQLKAARDAGVARVVAPASGAVYGASFYGDTPLDEDAPCLPTSLYGVSKYAVDRSAIRLAALWDMDVVVARIGSVFGPWERDTGLRDLLTPFWQIAEAARTGGEAVLPAVIPAYSWVYARDVAAAVVHLLDLPPAAGPARVFNICSGLPWGDEILNWCRALAASDPGFTWRQSEDPAEITIRFSETRPRVPMAIGRIRASGWRPAFPPEAAFADYLTWTRGQALLL